MHLGGVYTDSKVVSSEVTPVLATVFHRVPWLLLGLLGGIMTAGILAGFEKTLSDNLVLATFIPLIVYMADAVGTQMEAFIIRDLAINPRLNFVKYLFHQLLAVTFIGLLVSAVLYGFSLFLYGSAVVSLVLAISLMFAVVSSVMTGLLFPYLFGKLKLDPANASGPIATIIQDVLSVVVYFSVATWLL